jgi:hypothetical protein
LEEAFDIKQYMWKRERTEGKGRERGGGGGNETTV